MSDVPGQQPLFETIPLEPSKALQPHAMFQGVGVYGDPTSIPSPKEVAVIQRLIRIGDKLADLCRPVVSEGPCKDDPARVPVWQWDHWMEQYKPLYTKVEDSAS